jgi:hypothetical protein
MAPWPVAPGSWHPGQLAYWAERLTVVCVNDIAILQNTVHPRRTQYDRPESTNLPNKSFKSEVEIPQALGSRETGKLSSVLHEQVLHSTPRRLL